MKHRSYVTKILAAALCAALLLCVPCAYAEESEDVDGGDVSSDYEDTIEWTEEELAELYDMLLAQYDDAEKVILSNEELAVTEGLDPAWQNILLLGTDNRSAETAGRTDAMIILSVNHGTGKVKLTSIMRDTWVQMHGLDKRNKINTANVFGGPELAMRTVNECFGLNITRYALVNMQGLVHLVDDIGGVSLDVTAREAEFVNKYLDNYRVANASGGDAYLTASGEDTHMTGNQALAFARNRYSDNDYKRTERQRKVLIAIAERLMQNSVMEVMTAVGNLLQFISTNMTVSEILELALPLMSIDISGVEQSRLPADGTFEAGMFSGTWFIRADFDANTKLLHEFIYGEDET